MIGTEDWHVSDVIDEVDMTWNEVVIRDLFSELECEKILEIPLSFRRPQDKKVWCHNKSGLYDVKSGYRVAFSSLPVSMGLASTSHQAGPASGRSKKSLWKKVWSACVPPKVRAFLWKLCKGVVPTKVALSKKVRFVDTRCSLCEELSESDVHLFRDCKVAWQCWDVADMGFDPRKYPGCGAYQWIHNVSSHANDTQLARFFSILWGIWVDRCRIVFEGGTFQSQGTVAWALKLMSDYQKYHPPKLLKRERRLAKWSPPKQGWVKINMDGAYDGISGNGGIGIAARDWQGNILFAKYCHIPQGHSALWVEALALKDALFHACEQGWEKLEIESDCAELIKTFHQDLETGNDVGQVYVGQVVADCKTLTLLMHSFSFVHIFREANGVANRLARLASMSSMDSMWYNETPSIIYNVLVEDGCFYSRGFGSKSSPMYASIDLVLNNNWQGSRLAL